MLVPGTMFPMDITAQNSNSSENRFVKELIKALKKHANTISGICTALVIVSGVPVPIPFPWSGIS